MMRCKTVTLLKPLIADYESGILGMSKGCIITVIYDEADTEIKKSLEDVTIKDEDYMDMVNQVLDLTNEYKLIEELENG